jgi:transmembrane sensor
MNESRFRQLLEHYVAGQINTDDQREFFRLLERDEYRLMLESIMQQEWDLATYEESGNEQVGRLVEGIVMNRIGSEAPVKRMGVLRRFRVPAAAAILILLSAAYFLFLNKPRTEEKLTETKTEPLHDVQPGKYKAKLTIADGSSIVLDSAAQGQLVKQGNTQVFNRNGQLVYDSSVNQQSASLIYNTLFTARGEMYSTVLADGSKVWLNSASSVKFPVSFSGKERMIEITGEAYLEIAPQYSKNGKQRVPFIVRSGGQEITVLGTHFNINAYADEKVIRTTLLEGSVRVSSGNQSVLLRPGEQSILQNKFSVHAVNGQEVIAWKDGFFFYRHAGITDVMRQLARWYDVEVVYEGVNHGQTFTGKIDRSLPLSEVLKILEQTKVQSKIEGKKLVILP